jgi:mono/diheme cytochrome c family protein
MKRMIAGCALGFVLLPLAFAASIAMGWWETEATGEPPALEKKLARWALDSGLSHRAPRLRNPVAATGPELLEGMRFFQSGCAGCHGDGRAPSVWGSTSFYPRVPQFATTPPTRPDWEMFRIVKFGIRYSGMGGWGKLASDKQIWQTVTFLAHLRSLPPEVEAEWRKPASP